MINVVKVGGGIIENPDSLSAFLKSFALIPGKKILVHGGGRLATKMANDLGIETTMIEGRRVTDDKMLEIVTMVFGGLANKTVVAQLQALGVNAMGLSGADGNLIKAHKRTGSKVDYGWVGDIDEVNADLLLNLLDQGVTPVIAPLSHNGEGKMLNTNADTIASTVARSIATKEKTQLVMGFELNGVLRDFNDKESVITSINPSTYEELKSEGVIADGMIPKMDNSFDAINAGVSSVKICYALKVGEAVTNDGIGTTITAE